MIEVMAGFSLTRRDWILNSLAAPVLAAARAPSLPDKAAFAPSGVTYLDSATQHPISIGAKAQLDAYIVRRTLDPNAPLYRLDEAGIVAKFAQLINADKDEVTTVQSTTAGENLVVRALGLPAQGAHVVTDTLHFFGSFYLYEELARQGVEVTWIRPRNNRIDVGDIERSVRNGTRLVALSLVSRENGFEHDLKRVCEIAHAKGALVYADIVQAAGCVPIDVKAANLDFAACASYKWLMGDFGLGFLYARKDLLAGLKRPNFGYYGLGKFETHVFPFDAPGDQPADYAARADATGMFGIGTHAHACLALLDHSLGYLLDTGVDAIQAHARPLVARLKADLPKLGYSLMTPEDSRAPIVSCALEDARGKLSKRLDEARIRITVAKNRFRISPSVFNDMEDVERVLSVLKV